MKNVLLFLSVLIFFGTGCNKTPEGPLPVIGDRKDIDGNPIVHSIRPFSFTDQMGQEVTNDRFKDHIHIVDFFFTSCPSICPKVTAEMKRIYRHVDKYEDVLLVSQTIDPQRDSISVLKSYADNLDIDHSKWLFLRGEKEETMEIANEDYFIAALEAPDAPGGFDHSGKIVLLDKNAKIRGFCDGTDSESVDKFMKTIDRLRKEYEK